MATLMERLEDNKRNMPDDEGATMAKKMTDIKGMNALDKHMEKDANHGKTASTSLLPGVTGTTVEPIPSNPLEGVEDKGEAAKPEDKAVDAGAEFKVLTGIAIPDGRPARESKYPWDALEVGQSFFVPGAKTDTFNTLTSTRNKKGEKKFISRKWTGENGVLGVMVWRKS